MGGANRLAQELRIGLSDRKINLVGSEEYFHGKPITQHIKDFVSIFSIIFLITFAYFFKIQGFKYWQLIFPGIVPVLLFFGYKFPNLVKPVWQTWMKFGTALGLVMTTIILSIVWVIIVIPVALFLKLIGKKVMELDFNNPRNKSYWKIKESKFHDFKLMEREY